MPGSLVTNPMKTSLMKVVGGKAEEGMQISLFCPSAVGALHCPTNQPDKLSDFWPSGWPGRAGSWFGISLTGDRVVVSHRDQGGWPCETGIEADEVGVAREDSMTPGGKAVTGVTPSWQSGTDLHVWEGFETLWCEIARTPQKVSSSWGSKSWGKRVYAFWNACFTATIRTLEVLSLKTSILSLDFTSFLDFTTVTSSVTTDLFLFYKTTPGYILCSLFTLLQPLSQGYIGFLYLSPNVWTVLANTPFFPAWKFSI